MTDRFWKLLTVPILVFLFGVSAVYAAHTDTPPNLEHAPPAGRIHDDLRTAPLMHYQPQLSPTTIITVNSTLDPNETSLTFTCNYTGGVYVGREPVDGQCSFRRALLEASNRPPADRPILVAFDLSTGDANYNSATDSWSIMIDSGGNLLEIKPRFIVEPDGSVTVDGDTQPGGRSTGPKIIIESDVSFQISSNNNVIRNLAFQGDANVIINETQNVGNNNVIENLWVGLNDAGTDLIYDRNISNDPIGLKNGRIRIEQSDNNIIRNNIVAGADNDAGISVLGNLNLIENNQVGMRADGTIPFVANKCNFSGFFDPTSNWYGGGGITVNGAGNQVMTNTVAGMFNGGTDASARPPAIEVLGASGNDIMNNIIGKDTAGYEAGVCGLAIDVSGNRHDILDNQIFDGGIAETGSGFTEGSIFINESSFTFNQMTVRRNLVKDGQGLVIEFGPAVNSSNPIRKFNPGRVTDISGTSVQGTNGLYVDPLGIAPDDVNECPGCTIDLYADDLDGLQETLELLATTVADGNGNWSATLSRALTSNEGLRTQSTTQAAETITGYGPNTSTAVSVLYVAPLDIQLQQPANVTANIEATFVITVTPGQVTLPLTFTVESDEHTPIVAALNTNVASLSAYSWPTPGTKTMTITAENEIGSVTKLFTINVADDSNSDPDDFAIYLPLLIK